MVSLTLELDIFLSRFNLICICLPFPFSHYNYVFFFFVQVVSFLYYALFIFRQDIVSIEKSESQSCWWFGCGWCLIEDPVKSKGFRLYGGQYEYYNTYCWVVVNKNVLRMAEGWGLEFHGPFHRHWATNVLCVIFITNNFITHFTYLPFTVFNLKYSIYMRILPHL